MVLEGFEYELQPVIFHNCTGWLCGLCRRLVNIDADHRMVTKLGSLCKVKLLKDKGDTLVVRSPEGLGVSDKAVQASERLPVLHSCRAR
jgi:hypothetical protein